MNDISLSCNDQQTGSRPPSLIEWWSQLCAGAGDVIISGKSVRAAAFVLFDLSRLVSRPPLGGSDWSEPGRGRGHTGSVGAPVINWDDLLV